MENNDWLNWLIERDKTELKLLEEQYKQSRRLLHQSINGHEAMITKLDLLTELNKEKLENQVLADKILDLENKIGK